MSRHWEPDQSCPHFDKAYDAIEEVKKRNEQTIEDGLRMVSDRDLTEIDLRDELHDLLHDLSRDLCDTDHVEEHIEEAREINSTLRDYLHTAYEERDHADKEATELREELEQVKKEARQEIEQLEHEIIAAESQGQRW